MIGKIKQTTKDKGLIPRQQLGVRVDADVSRLRPEAQDMLDKIKEMRLKDAMVNQAMNQQQIVSFSDFEMVILLAYHSLSALRKTQENYKSHLDKCTNTIMKIDG